MSPELFISQFSCFFARIDITAAEVQKIPKRKLLTELDSYRE
jgi:hypothetical protein